MTEHPAFHIDQADLSLEDWDTLQRDPAPFVGLSPAARETIQSCKNFLDQKLSTADQIFYGINTGFGSLCNTHINEKDLGLLQVNLVRSHACGIGDEVPIEIVKLMLLLKARSLSFGHSGVRPETVEQLLTFFNHGIYPLIYAQGSLGASGDLAPLAHLSLALIGKGEVWYKGVKRTASEVLRETGIPPLVLQPKEGLALLNGTQFMLAYGLKILLEAKRLAHLADMISALSLDAFDCRSEPFDPLLHAIRHHPGQITVASHIRQLLKGSTLFEGKKVHVQDPYSFRCIPQVHGASRDAMDYIEGVFHREANGVTDNPNIFVEEDKILSGGNFHGQPLALALDHLSIVLAEFGSISERRTFQLLSGDRDLPAFLIAEPGLNSGLMISQYTAASIASQNKQYCSPAVVDSIPSSNGQEDHVSMGANGAVKCYKVLENLRRILAIELINASQALFFREPLQTSPRLEPFLNAFRAVVPFIQKDRIIGNDIRNAEIFLADPSLEEFLHF